MTGRAWPIPTAVAAGGAFGGTARYAVDLALPTAPGQFPSGTLLVNVVGCLLVGALAGWVHRPRAHPLLYPFVVPGLLGGFTTFSTYTGQTVDLALRGEVGSAATYLLVTLLLALLAAEAGLLLGRGLAHRARQSALALPRRPR